MGFSVDLGVRIHLPPDLGGEPPLTPWSGCRLRFTPDSLGSVSSRDFYAGIHVDFLDRLFRRTTALEMPAERNAGDLPRISLNPSRLLEAINLARRVHSLLASARFNDSRVHLPSLRLGLIEAYVISSLVNVLPRGSHLTDELVIDFLNRQLPRFFRPVHDSIWNATLLQVYPLLRALYGREDMDPVALRHALTRNDDILWCDSIASLPREVTHNRRLTDAIARFSLTGDLGAFAEIELMARGDGTEAAEAIQALEVGIKHFEALGTQAAMNPEAFLSLLRIAFRYRNREALAFLIDRGHFLGLERATIDPTNDRSNEAIVLGLYIVQFLGVESGRCPPSTQCISRMEAYSRIHQGREENTSGSRSRELLDDFNRAWDFFTSEIEGMNPRPPSSLNFAEIMQTLESGERWEAARAFWRLHSRAVASNNRDLRERVIQELQTARFHPDLWMRLLEDNSPEIASEAWRVLGLSMVVYGSESAREMLRAANLVTRRWIFGEPDSDRMSLNIALFGLAEISGNQSAGGDVRNGLAVLVRARDRLRQAFPREDYPYYFSEAEYQKAIGARGVPRELMILHDILVALATRGPTSIPALAMALEDSTVAALYVELTAPLIESLNISPPSHSSSGTAGDPFEAPQSPRRFNRSEAFRDHQATSGRMTTTTTPSVLPALYGGTGLPSPGQTAVIGDPVFVGIPVVNPLTPPSTVPGRVYPLLPALPSGRGR